MAKALLFEDRPRQLIADQRGATMVMGVFIATLLVGMIYYVWGIGDTIMFRERMQDASDTAAFSAAVMHARGMNMIALLNMIMSALAVVAATMATITLMIQTAFIAATFVCAFCGPWCGSCCSACPYAVKHGIEYNSASNTNDRIQNIVETAMTGLSGYARGIRYGVPLAAQAKVVSYGTDIYDPVTDFGVMSPPLRTQLPVIDDESNWPCDEFVYPWVAAFSPVFVWIWGSASPYMAGGILAGELAAPSKAREWCDDGYFQRVGEDAEEHGVDAYQVQAFMIGSPDQDWTAEGVSIATWGEGDDAGSEFSAMAQTGKVAFAQAEFFYDDDEDDWREWLWHMNWRARLRRFRVSAMGGGNLGSICGSVCGAIGSFVGGSLDDMVVH
ncbi:MAG: TadE/TadG family type IV pilus assembly protein [Sandaracinaceae bacterium]